MTKVLTVVRKEYLERVRSKSFLVGTLLGPALMSMFIVLPVLLGDKGGDNERRVGVVDPSGMYFDRMVAVAADQGRESLVLERVEVGPDVPDAAVETLKQGILGESLHSGVLVAPDFLDRPQVTFYNKSVGATILREEILRPIMNQILREQRMAAAEVPDSLYTYLAARTTWESLTVTDTGEEQASDDEASFAVAIILIMIIYIMVIMYGSHTLTAVIEEKSSRMVEVLLASVSPENLMLGKVLGIGLAGLTQFGIWAGTMLLLSSRGVSVGDFTLDMAFLTPTILISFVMFFVLGFFLYATLYAGVGAMCNTVQDSQQFHMPLAMGLVIPMVLMSVILRAPDAPLAVILSLVPFFAPVIMFMRVCVETPPLWQIGLSWLIMIVTIWLASRAAGKLFRVGILMHGESPTWGTLGKVLRG